MFRKVEYNLFDVVLRELVSFFLRVLFLLLISTYALADSFGLKEIITEGRAVVIDGNKEIAKKRALDDALYLASLRGGAKIDGYSNVDNLTRLNENLLVRPASTITDFVILDEKEDKSHYVVKIKAYLININTSSGCSERNFVNLSYLSPHFTVSSKLEPWTHKLPNVISDNIRKNLRNIDFIRLKDKSNVFFNVKRIPIKSSNLDYDSIVEGKSMSLKDGEFAVHPTIIIDSIDGNIGRFSKEILIKLRLDVYQNSNFNLINSLEYDFSLFLGQKTGYQHIDAFYKKSYDKIRVLVEKSLSKVQYRVMDQLKCHPLEAVVKQINNKLIVSLGSNQGLSKDKLGIISPNGMDVSMNDWIVVTVKNINEDFSEIEPLNPNNKNEFIEGKFIKFIN